MVHRTKEIVASRQQQHQQQYSSDIPRCWRRVASFGILEMGSVHCRERILGNFEGMSFDCDDGQGEGGGEEVMRGRFDTILLLGWSFDGMNDRTKWMNGSFVRSPNNPTVILLLAATTHCNGYFRGIKSRALDSSNWNWCLSSYTFSCYSNWMFWFVKYSNIQVNIK